MELQKDIKVLLNQLKSIGWDRRRIEKKLGYSEKYLDQAVTKGGNDKLYASLSFLYDQMNTLHPEDPNMLQESPSTYIQKRREQKNESIEFRVPLVSIQARAGYTKSYGNVDLLNTLDKYAIPPGVSYIGAIWRYFEVGGDSMEDTLQAGDYILCSQVPNEDWSNNIRDYYIYVLVTETDILIKRIFVKDTGEWVLISDNEAKVKQKLFDPSDLKELWLFRRRIQKSFKIKKTFKINV